MNQHLNRRTWLKLSGLATGAWSAKALAAAEAPRAAEGSVAFQRNLPVKRTVDVFVAGGGPAGVAAAVAARSYGAEVFLAEAHTCLGGMGTAGRVPVFMPFTDGIHFLGMVQLAFESLLLCNVFLDGDKVGYFTLPVFKRRDRSHFPKKFAVLFIQETTKSTV